MSIRVILYYTTLFLAIAAGSSAAAAFEKIVSVSPYMKSCWRLQLTALFQFIPGFFECFNNWQESKQMIIRFWPVSRISGICLAALFCLWCVSLNLTSVSHSLLFLSASPLVIVAIFFFKCEKISVFEILGVAVGFLGLSVCIFESKGSESSSWYGDALAFGCAIALAIYILINKTVMTSEAPLWTYLAIVNLQAAIISYICALISGDEPIAGIQWIYTDDWLMAMYLGLIPGALGNAAFTHLIKHIPALVISVFMNFQPLIGSFIGWCVGIEGIPSIYTWMGGIIVIIGNTIVSISSARNRKTDKRQLLKGKNELAMPLVDFKSIKV
ncbi:unnamed protein product [Blepharisma stoltei]|uniref:EamA domain-containing protein n=1 Tax=Blepharisma stoltei TaxID=1481888 RepID=A0AAU9IV28_9CILI|nr:unnamed protein product [Blepharisma stoltei]